MTDEQSKINAAFEIFFPSDFSKARQRIVESYGAEIAAQVDLIFRVPRSTRPLIGARQRWIRLWM